MPLPFKDTDVKLPNNRNQAIRSKLAEMKVSKGLKIFWRVQEEYGRTLRKKVHKKIRKKSKWWRIVVFVTSWSHLTPWCGKYHNPSKLGKVRIAFDSSANFGGACLNNKLLAGPGLTNLLAGVLFVIQIRQSSFHGWYRGNVLPGTSSG